MGVAEYRMKAPIYHYIRCYKCTDEFVKWPWVLKHFYSHKWARNITREEMD